jgi:hypothetical protein
VAPETVSMLALWADSASPWRIGATSWEMKPDRPWLGSWSAVTAVILPPARVIWTWTSPNGFWTAEPVNVPLPLVAGLVGGFVGAGVALGAGVPAATGGELLPGGTWPTVPGPVEASGASETRPGPPSAAALSAGVLKLKTGRGRSR